MWFRIELDSSGAILSCAEVELAERQGRLVRYVEAPNKTEACSSVKQWNERRLRAMVEKRQAIVARRHAEGKCTECESLALAGAKMCQIHLERHRAYGKRDRERLKQGTNPGRKRLTPEMARLIHIEPAIRVSKIIFELDRLGPVAFRAWLVSLLREKLSRAA